MTIRHDDDNPPVFKEGKINWKLLARQISQGLDEKLNFNTHIDIAEQND